MTDLARATPSSADTDAAGIAAFVDAVLASGTELHTLMILRRGEVIAETRWAPYELDRPNLLYSLSKSFVSAAAGLAIGEGRFGLDDRIVDHFPDLVPADLGEHWRELRVRHCLSMATGHLDDPAFPFPEAGTDWLRYFFTLPPEREPGTVFTYNQFATYTVARLIEQTSGQRVLDYLRPRLFAPLGITEAAWLTDGHGHDAGFSGLHLSTEAVARFGQLLLQQGTWQGQQILDPAWIEQASRVQMPNDAAHRRPGVEPPTIDWGSGYGFQFWIATHGYRGDGAYGQFCIVLPQHDALVVTTAETMDMQGVLDQAWTHLLPAFDRPGSEAADRALVERLANLRLEGPADDESGSDTVELSRDGGDAARSVTSVRVRANGSAYALECAAGDQRWELPVGRGEWARGTWKGDASVPFMSWGGWQQGRFVAQLRMIQTPHRIDLVADPQAGTVSLQWRYPPLHGDPEAHRLTEE
ncbi:serine hydrolase [Calidifontibacter sp. DB0510]|uniref:Serine hydrolase n=1 Tax=Metallococcus carri TaxID=1656884 RepID=A0A967EB65_9MICO|nr:serine hydrolase [Metallococcus carri]NHN56985.1 serine hydrolase [Metallococcus carri]NOP37730.1 serine hydrolase [Calidifontibacter sp. DB2511S]